MENEKLLKKLQVKPGSDMLVLNAPQSFLDALQPLPADLALSTDAAGNYDYVHLFVKDRAELKQHATTALSAIKPEGLLWFSYPKKSAQVQTDLTRDIGWEPITRAGYRGIRQVSIDSTWSAVRFRQVEEKEEEDIVEAQFKGAKASLRPIYDRIITIVEGLGDDVILAPRQSYIAFTCGKIFAVAKASSKTRLDLGLKLPGKPTTKRLVDAGSFASGSITHKVALHNLEDVDDAVNLWLHEAYSAVKRS